MAAFSHPGHSRTVGMTTTTFTWDINASLSVVLDDGPSGEGYLYGAGLSAMKQSGDGSFARKDYLADGLGSTMAVVDGSGVVQTSYQYDVYGEVTGGSGSLSNEFDFAGQQTDPTGLQYLRARYYDPATGVFLSREPLERLPGWMGNPFGYGAANPARYLDPTGLVPVDSDGCRDNDTGCQRRVQAESEGACARLYFYTYRYCKDRVPFSDWTLLGEYTLNRLLDLAKFWQSGLEAVGEGQIREAEFAASIGPRIHACALDFTCSNAVALGLMSAAAVLAVIPGGQGFAAAVTAAGLVWEAYAYAAQSAQPPTSLAQDR